MSDFEGSKSIILQPGDAAIPYTFEWTVCSASTGNDGGIPYGHSLSSVVSSVHHEDGTVLSTAIISASSVTNNVLTIWLSYPTCTGTIFTGRHHMEFLATISDGTTTYIKEFDFNRLILGDL